MSHSSSDVNQSIKQVHNQDRFFLELTATFQTHCTLIRPEQGNAFQPEQVLVTFKEEIRIQELVFIDVKIKEENAGSELFESTFVHSELLLKVHSLASQKPQRSKHKRTEELKPLRLLPWNTAFLVHSCHMF